MKISKRLIIYLMIVIIMVMAIFGYLRHVDRTRDFRLELQKEGRVVAKTLKIAMGDALRDKQLEDLKVLVEQIGGYENVFGLVVVDKGGNILFMSKTLSASDIEHGKVLKTALTKGEALEGEGELRGRPVYFHLLPLKDDKGGIIGAFGLFLDASSLEQKLASSRRKIIITILILLAVSSMLILIIMRKSISGPINDLIEGAKLVGEGRFDHRLKPRRDDEIGGLAREFNKMAEKLEAMQAQIIAEHNDKLKLERKLMESEKLAAIGQLASGLAHEIGTPLNIVAGRAEYLFRKFVSDGNLKKHLETIVTQIDRITRIMDQLLNLARRRPLNLRPSNLNALISNVLDLLDSHIQKQGIKVDLRLEPELPKVYLDGDKIQQVLLNIVLNAVQAMLEGGDLKIESRAIKNRSSVPGEGGALDYIEIVVGDTGSGIAADDLPKIFDPFFTTKSDIMGTGLGLSVSQGIVKEHGGEIIVESAQGKGSIFSVRLPAEAGQEVRLG